MKARFKECRKKANLSQKEVASALKVSVQAVSYWENGSRMPSHENCVSLASLYNVTVGYLLGVDEEPLHTVTVADNFSDHIANGRDMQSAVTYPGAKAVGRSVSYSMTHGGSSIDAGHGESAVQWYNAAGDSGESLVERLRSLSPARQQQALDYIKFLEMQDEEE